MAVTDFKSALSYTNKQLAKLKVTRAWVHGFWAEHTPEGIAVCKAASYGCNPKHAEKDDKFFITSVVADTQRFVFSCSGDAALGVPEQPAAEAEVDGCLGPKTHNRMLAWAAFAANKIEPLEPPSNTPSSSTSDFLLFGGQKIPVEGVQIITFEDPEGLDITDKARTKGGKKRGYTPWPKPIKDLIGKDPVFARLLGFVHWDAGWSAKGAFNVLVQRELGSCVGIDRPRKEDGAVICYQWLDPGKYYGWHGGTEANRGSIISFDMSNAVDIDYYNKYKELCGIPRPKLHISGREKIGEGQIFLGMYKDQILSLLRILKALSAFSGLPLVFPVNPDGTSKGRNYKGLFTDPYHGVASHMHLPTTTKWDVQGLEAQIVVLLLTDAKLQQEFPSLVQCFRLQDSHWGPWLDQVKKAWRWEEVWGA